MSATRFQQQEVSLSLSTTKRFLVLVNHVLFNAYPFLASAFVSSHVRISKLKGQPFMGAFKSTFNTGEFQDGDTCEITFYVHYAPCNKSRSRCYYHNPRPPSYSLFCLPCSPCCSFTSFHPHLLCFLPNLPCVVFYGLIAPLSKVPDGSGKELVSHILNHSLSSWFLLSFQTRKCMAQICAPYSCSNDLPC